MIQFDVETGVPGGFSDQKPRVQVGVRESRGAPLGRRDAGQQGRQSTSLVKRALLRRQLRPVVQPKLPSLRNRSTGSPAARDCAKSTSNSATQSLWPSEST